MEKIAHKLASNISKALNYNYEQEQVIRYGLIAIIQVLVTILLVSIIASILHILPEALIITFSVSLLRKYSGGSHANTIEACTATAVIYSIVFALISKTLLRPIFNSISLIAVTFTIFLLAYWIIYKKAPVDSPNKPIKSPQKIKRMRKGSFLVLTAYLIVSVLFIQLSQSDSIWISYTLSLLFGIAWQIITLTRVSAILFKNLTNV